MRIVITAGVLAAALGLAGPTVARSRAASDVCHATTVLAIRACEGDARASKMVALGKCANVTDAAAKKACTEQATADAKDALQTCMDERAVRQTSCKKLGPTAYDPVIDPTNFPLVPKIDNPFFPLTPGKTYVYEGQMETGFERDEFAVTHNTKVIMGVTCVEVHDTVKTNGEVTEDTLDWFAQDNAGVVWYFGEHTMELVGGLATTLEGSFAAGVDHAKPGIIMEANPAVGDFYRQEFDLRNAEDFAEVTSLDETVTVPCGAAQGCTGSGTYDHALLTSETTPLEPDLHENKFYARGIGNLSTVNVDTGEKSELVMIITVP
jgi:hypothetical protein